MKRMGKMKRVLAIMLTAVMLMQSSAGTLATDNFAGAAGTDPQKMDALDAADTDPQTTDVPDAAGADTQTTDAPDVDTAYIDGAGLTDAAENSGEPSADSDSSAQGEENGAPGAATDAPSDGTTVPHSESEPDQTEGDAAGKEPAGILSNSVLIDTVPETEGEETYGIAKIAGVELLANEDEMVTISYEAWTSDGKKGGGTVNPESEKIVKGGKVAEGSTAKAADGYKFVKWTYKKTDGSIADSQLTQKETLESDIILEKQPSAEKSFT